METDKPSKTARDGLQIAYSEMPAIRENFPGFLAGIEIAERRQREGIKSAIPEVFTRRRPDLNKLKALDESLAEGSVKVSGPSL